MRFNLPKAPERPEIPTELRVGNVYPSKGGRGTRYWVVINIREKGVDLIGLDAEGEISGATSYGRWAFENGSRPLLGRVEGLDRLDFDIQWEEQP